LAVDHYEPLTHSVVCNDCFVVDVNFSNNFLSTKVAKLNVTDEYISANMTDNGYKSVSKILLLILRGHFLQQKVCPSNMVFPQESQPDQNSQQDAGTGFKLERIDPDQIPL